MRDSADTTQSTRPENLTPAALKGLRWSLLVTVTTFAAQVPYSAVMSRILSPGDFGLVAYALLMLRFVSYFAQGGLGAAVVQRPVLESRDVRASLTVGLMSGLGLYGAFWVVTPLAVSVLHASGELTSVCRALALTFVILALGSTAAGLLRRTMRYRSIALVEIGSYVVGYCGLGLTSAVLGNGAWSLVHAVLGQTSLTALGNYAFVRHDIRPLFDGQAMRSVASFGAKVSFVGFLEYLTTIVDNTAVVRYAGTAALGQYNRAAFMVSLPLEQLGMAVSKVLFPAFSRIQTEHGRLKDAYNDTIAMTTLLFLPLAAVIAASSENSVQVLLGDQWRMAARLVPILAVAGALNVVVHFPAVVAEATGRVWQKAAIECVQLVTLLLGIGIAVACDAGILGLATAVLVGRVLRHVSYIVWMGRVIPGSLHNALVGYTQASAVALVAGLTVAVVGHAVGAIAPAPVALAAQLTTVGLVGTLTLLYGGSLRGIRVGRDRGLIPKVFGTGRRSGV